MPLLTNVQSKDEDPACLLPKVKDTEGLQGQMNLVCGSTAPILASTGAAKMRGYQVMAHTLTLRFPILSVRWGRKTVKKSSEMIYLK